MELALTATRGSPSHRPETTLGARALTAIERKTDPTDLAHYPERFSPLAPKGDCANLIAFSTAGRRAGTKTTFSQIGTMDV